MRGWIRGSIWLQIAYLNNHFSGFWDFSVFDILVMVSDPLVLYFDTEFRFLLCFKAAKKTRNAKPFMHFHGLSLISGGFEATWGQRVGRLVAGCGGFVLPL